MSKQPEWKDATSYSRGERGNIDPNTWSIETKSLRLTVVRMHEGRGVYSTEWYGICHDLNISSHNLQTDDLETAKAHLLSVVQYRLEAMLLEVKELT